MAHHIDPIGTHYTEEKKLQISTQIMETITIKL
jgi:hypothetical protein